MSQFKKIILIEFCLLVALGVTILIVYQLAGPNLIKDIYYGKSIAPLNKLIIGQDVHSLNYYTQVANKQIGMAIISLIVICPFVMGLSYIFYRRLLLCLLFNLLVVIACTDLLVLFFFNNTDLVRKVPQPIRTVLQSLYKVQRNTIVYLPECARYDPELTYTLRPGKCYFSNIEFNNLFQINSAGLRDDEASLDNPSIIVLGDSVTMGWGMEQHETYPQRLERKTNKKVLNAGISSYGTVREMWMLNRLDLSKVEVLIIQHSQNDDEENHAFKRTGTLPISGKKLYLHYANKYGKRPRGYFPGKYFISAFEILTDQFFFYTDYFLSQDNDFTLSHTDEDENCHSSAENFLYVLTNAVNKDLTGIKIIVIPGNDCFASALRNLIERDKYPSHIKEITIIKILPPTDAFFKEFNYILDKHFNAAWHKFISNQILEKLSD